MTFSIRLAETSDREAIIDLWRRAGLTRPWNDPVADFDRALAETSSCVLALDMDRALAGSVMVGYDGHRGWVYYLATDPDRRRRGVGRALMAAAEDWLKARGAPKLNLMVRGDNLDATGFYAALGYDESDVRVLAKRLDGGTMGPSEERD